MKENLIGVPGLAEGRIAGVTKSGQPVVNWAASEDSSCSAEVVWLGATVDWRHCRGLRVLLGFRDGEVLRPVVLGLLDAPPEEAVAEIAPIAGSVKQRSIKLEADEELLLECGRAKISLRADGRVTILGDHLLSRSRGVNKLKGGSVKLN